MSTAKKQSDNWKNLVLSAQDRFVVRAFANYQNRNPSDQTGATRAQISPGLMLSTEQVNKAISRLRKMGVLYATDHRRGGQSCYRYENNVSAWPGRAHDYACLMRYRRVTGLLNEYENQMSPELRDLLREFGAQNQMQK